MFLLMSHCKIWQHGEGEIIKFSFLIKIKDSSVVLHREKKHQICIF